MFCIKDFSFKRKSSCKFFLVRLPELAARSISYRNLPNAEGGTSLNQTHFNLIYGANNHEVKNCQF